MGLIIHESSWGDLGLLIPRTWKGKERSNSQVRLQRRGFVQGTYMEPRGLKKIQVERS